MRLTLVVIFLTILLTNQSNAQHWSFTSEWNAGQYDINGNWTGGTELLNIRVHKGQLFATTGYWRDEPGTNPVSGPHILRKDSINSNWVADITFDAMVSPQLRRHLRISSLESIIFTKDTLGNDISSPDTLLIAGVDDAFGLGVRVRNDQNGTYETAVISVGSDPFGQYNIIRSMVKYTDPLTGGEFLYVGGRSAIYKGWYDASEPSKLKFSSSPVFLFPTSATRVTSMTIANDKLYAGCGSEQNIAGGVWEKDTATDHFSLVYQLPFPGSNLSSNIRGLTTIPSQNGSADSDILLSFEGNGDIIRLEPWNNFNSTVEINIPDYFDTVPNTYSTNLAAYNEMTPFQDQWIIGVGVTNATATGEIDETPPNNGTYFLVRNQDASYTHQYIYDTSQPVAVGKNLRVVRTVCVSPFDTNNVYLGGFDAGGGTSQHNTAWIYKGTLQDIVSGIEDTEYQPLDLKLYPNPAKNQLSISNLPSSFYGSVNIYNATGQLIQTGKKTGTEFGIETQRLKSGVYFIQIKTPNGSVVTRKFIKQ